MNAKVEALRVFTAKGLPPIDREKADLVKDAGMKGDRHSKGGSRQISIMLKKAEEWKKQQTVEGLCFEKFNANIVLSGAEAENLRAGAILQIGEAKIRLTEAKPCYDTCPFLQREEACILKTHGIFAEVLQSGSACIGDPALIDKK
jgi:MOSC domain-containing protein YiiM